MEKKTLEEIKQEITDIEKQRAQLFDIHQEKKNLFNDKKTEQEAALIAGKNTSKIVTEIAKLQIEIQGLFRAIKTLDDNLEQAKKTQAIEFQGFALARAEELGSQAVEALKPAYKALVDFVEKNSQAMAKASGLDAILRKVKRPTPMTHLHQRLSGLFYDIEKELPLILERFPQEIFQDEKLPKPAELKRRLNTVLGRRNTVR